MNIPSIRASKCKEASNVSDKTDKDRTEPVGATQHVSIQKISHDTKPVFGDKVSVNQD